MAYLRQIIASVIQSQIGMSIARAGEGAGEFDARSCLKDLSTAKEF